MYHDRLHYVNYYVIIFHLLNGSAIKFTEKNIFKLSSVIKISEDLRKKLKQSYQT